MPLYTMKQVCKAADMKYETLKFYCNQGLIPYVKRDKNNHRVFDEHDLGWVKSLNCLKNCDFTIAEMKKYLALCLEGVPSIPTRQQMLARKDEALHEKIAAIQEAIDYIAWKQGFYRDVLSGKIPYKSDLLPSDDGDGTDEK